MHLKFVILMAFILNSFFAQLQATNYNTTIEERINQIKDSEEKVDLMNQIADSLSYLLIDRAIQILDRALNLAKKINYTEGIADNYYGRGCIFVNLNNYELAEKSFEECTRYISLRSDRGMSCLNFLGYIHSKLGKYGSAIADYKQLLKLNIDMEKSPNNISEIFTNLGNMYLLQDKFYSAQEMYLRSLEFAKKNKNMGLIADCYVNMGIVASNLNNIDKAKFYNLKALKINEQQRDVQRIANNLINLSKIFLNNNQNDSALIFLNRTLDFIRLVSENNLTNDLKQVKANSLADIAVIMYKKNDYNKALQFALEAKKINLEINYLTGYYWDLLNISQIYISLKKNLDSAKIYLDSAYSVAMESDNLPLIVKIYLTYSNYYYFFKNVDSVNYYWDKYIEIQDVIYNNNIQSLIISLEDKLNLEKELSEHQIQELEKDRKQWIVIISLIASLSALLIVAFVIWWARRKSEKLLLNVLPKSIAKRLKTKKKSIADSYESASIVFIDITQFTNLSKDALPERIVELLNRVYTEFDHIAEKHGLEKIKTIGDCYMAAAGVPIQREDHAEAAAKFAIEAMEKLSGYDTGDGTKIQFKCGIDCGPVVAGVIGKKKFIYDIWGDAVNTASRMEENGKPGRIHCTKRFKEKISDKCEEINIKFEERGEIDVKGKGKMRTFFFSRQSTVDSHKSTVDS